MSKVNIYKYSLFQKLVARGHRFLRTKPNERNPQYVVYVFRHTEELERDLAELTGYTYIKEEPTD